jgi:hypothetical protein
VIEYICAIVIAIVRLGVERQAFVKILGTVIKRGLIVRTCKCECMQCVRSEASLHQVCEANSVCPCKSMFIATCVRLRMRVCNAAFVKIYCVHSTVLVYVTSIL